LLGRRPVVRRGAGALSPRRAMASSCSSCSRCLASAAAARRALSASRSRRWRRRRGNPVWWLIATAVYASESL